MENFSTYAKMSGLLQTLTLTKMHKKLSKANPKSPEIMILSTNSMPQSRDRRGKRLSWFTSLIFMQILGMSKGPSRTVLEDIAAEIIPRLVVHLQGMLESLAHSMDHAISL